MTTIDEMYEFVDWDHAAGPDLAAQTEPTAMPLDLPSDTLDMSSQDMHSELTTGIDLPPLNSDPNLDLALENVADDDFSFWALEHFTSHSTSFANPEGAPPPETTPALTLDVTPESGVQELYWETPSAPCDHCQRGGYQCKRIQEGKYKGYCTSCVALRCQCSFGFTHDSSAPARGATFPPNPWPTLGDHPDPIINYDLGKTPVHNPEALDLKPAPKVGARFSRESVKTLKNWLSTHSRHPYPTDEEKEALVRQTGLNKLQITNWLANARRRGKIQAPRSTSPHVRSTLSGAGAIDIPRRRGTPSPLEAMNPLQRWVESPPDHEPASVTDIARAITTSSSTVSSGLSSPYGLKSDDGSGKSLCNWSSASSLGTSQSSNNSFASAYSHNSRNSLGSINSLSINRGRRRRRRRQGHPQEGTPLHAPLKTYQCTFCTLTFRTKHDWQRHEKSLHLSLERWVCAPDGPRALNPATGQIACVFCGDPNPDETHIDAHNHCACQDRSLEERTFYRKDHLRQHLKLVHNAKFLSWSMDPWKIATPEIRSRCGFCGIVMDSWTFRVDHLAEHFKTGCSMADWKGDWGFDAPVMDMLENCIPPYLIHEERNSPLPYTPGTPPPESPRNAYELLKLELVSFVSNSQQPFSDQEIQHEGCRIIFGAEVLSQGGISSVPSWLRDLVMSSSPQITESARLGKVRSHDENRLPTLKINGKDNIFDDCPFELELQEFCKAKNMLGLTAMDDELQEEACRIIGRKEEMSSHPADDIANWFVRLIYSSTAWLAPFRQRALLPRSEDVGGSNRSRDPSTIDSTIYNYSRLERELAEYVREQRVVGVEPTDADLQRQGRIIIYEFDDAWNQTAADNEQWLAAFRQRHLDVASGVEPTPQTAPKAGMFFLNDANCYRRLARELSRWVKIGISPNNPNRHVPTDIEIQHQARWILYDEYDARPLPSLILLAKFNSDDPWNQTAADNAEWLRRFKRDVGLLADSGPGLPETDSWAVQLGGSGFAPPYVNPNTHMPSFQHLGQVPICVNEGTKTLTAPAQSANKYLETLSTRYPPMPKVFCPRELENGLIEFTQGEMLKGRFPSDDELRQQARLILGTEKTPADDAVLLEGFKDMARQKVCGGVNVDASWQNANPMRLTENELNDMLQDINFDIDSHAADLAATAGLGLDLDISPPQGI
ncbi:Homeobox protein 4 [Zalerion maritima]|uniref:Homeobox protein 4 n=1 Tax=Zalerion maritima TaxID=339359 RepID=A0AAD5RY42_9PEZI|nr:Homeobox protein 4 [Zalerion maritima]